MRNKWLPLALVWLLATASATIPAPVQLSSARISTLAEEQEGPPRSTTAEVVGSGSAGDASMSSLSLSLVTWNFAEQCPRSEDAAFLKGFRNGSDIVVLGVQECEDIKPRRHEGHRSRAWRDLQKKTFGKGYKCVAQHRMGGLQIAVYGNKKACKLIQGMQILDVACGVGNVLTNKGGISILLRIKGQTLALINGHFAAHQTKVSERNADFHRILSSITARAQPRWLVKALAQKRKSVKRRGSTQDPWLEQMFQAVGLPEDKIHAQRQAAASSRDMPKRLEKADSGSRPLQPKKSKIKNKSNSNSNSKSKSRAREVTLQSLIPDEVLGFKVKFPSPAGGGGGGGGGGGAKRSPIIPSIKKKKEKVVEETASDDSDEELPRRGVDNSRVFSIHDRLQSSFNSRGSSASTASSVQTRMLLPESRNVLPSLEDVPFDAVVFLGDFNYRVDLPRLEMEDLAEKATREASIDVAQLQRLLEFDQLGRERRLGKVFRGFSEGDIRFLPTFKYDKGSAKFDSSAKARCPAWTDRILYAVAASNNSRERGMQLLLSDYYSIDSRHSDHRPVAAEFLLTL